MNRTAVDSRRDLRAQILDEATRLFAEQGYEATSIREVVAAAHCTKPALYYYFASKEVLFREVIRRQVEAVSSMIRDSVSRPGTVRERLHETLADFVSHVQRNPAGMRLLQRVELRPEEGAPEVDVAGSRELHMRLMEDIVQQGVQTGEVRSDIEPRLGAKVLAGAVAFQFQMWLCGETWCPDHVHAAVDLLFDGISTR